MLKRTPLYAAHQRLNARLVEFGGWEMPVQYTGIAEEHRAVREAAGLFDIAHMGEAFVRGAGARDFLNATLTNDIARLGPGQGQYTLMCNEKGGVVDDLYAYCIGPENYLLIINASRIEPDIAWLTARHQAWAGRAGVTLENASDALSAVALQGPRSATIIDAALPGPSTGGTAVSRPSELTKNQLTELSYQGQRLYVARTGYTGEDGFEIVAPNGLIEAVWNELLRVGAPHRLVPAGLGARDTLRTEMCYPLYGHELDEVTTPIEAGLGFFVALDKPDFVGKSVLARQKAEGPTKRCVAFVMEPKGAPPRHHYAVFSMESEGVRIGEVTSGTPSPSLASGIGMAFVRPEFASPGTPIAIEVRGKRFPARVVKKPIYRKTQPAST